MRDFVFTDRPAHGGLFVLSEAACDILPEHFFARIAAVFAGHLRIAVVIFVIDSSCLSALSEFLVHVVPSAHPLEIGH